MSFSHKEFRQTLGCYGTGVAVITLINEAGRDVGVTINSFASVSLEPPLILFSMDNNSNIASLFSGSKKFVVNVLAHDQEKMAMNFARPSTATWSEIHFSRGENNCAKLSGSLAFLECSIESIFPGGDHKILIGRVEQIDSGVSADPLLFYRGFFGTHLKNAKINETLLRFESFNFIDHVWA
jgi:flavin reductase (DIM6/NTAB) family NADH-FMN oxidoreductase RutF